MTLSNNNQGSKFSPIFAQIEISTRCNLNCKVCPDKSNELMSFEKFKSIIDRMPLLNLVQLQGIGEPFLNPDLFKMMKLLKDRNIKMRIVTNGIATDEEIIRYFDNNIIENVCISVDSYHNQDPSFDEYLKKMFFLANSLKEYYRVSLHTIFSKENVKSCLDILYKANKCELQVNMLSLVENEDIYLQPNEMKREVDKFFRERNISLDHLKILFSADLSCYFYPNCIYIRVGGEITPCCKIYWGDFGNILDTPQEKMFSEKYKIFKTNLWSGKTPSECFNCEWCPSKPENKRADSPEFLIV